MNVVKRPHVSYELFETGGFLTGTKIEITKEPLSPNILALTSLSFISYAVNKKNTSAEPNELGLKTRAAWL
jgi:hypothetical protein